MSEDFAAMEPRVLDGKVQEKFFCDPVVWRDYDDPFTVDKDRLTGITIETPVPPYSESVESAWHIVEKLIDRGKRFTIEGDCDRGFVVEIMTKERESLSRVRSASASRAIAEAAVQLPD